jgi:hypothetical protein
MWFEYFENRLKTPWKTLAWGSEAPYNFPRYANPWTNEILVDKICRYENLENELHKVFSMLNVPYQGMSNHREKSHFRKDRRHYNEFLPMEYKDRIAYIFRKEIDLMEYEF